MKSLKVLGGSTVTGVAIAAMVAVPVFACHPQGKILKTVQDVTTKSAASDANDAAHALSVTQGDILTYTITVSNQETVPGSKGEDEMTNTVLTDTLPAGVQLVSNPGQTTITENLGNIKAKGTVTKSYQVKVTTTTEGELVNKACYTSGSNLGSKYNQNGCDVAIVKVSVPKTPPVTPPVTPPTTPTPTTPTPTPTTPTPTTPAEVTSLPNTGASTFLAPIAAVVTAAGAYVGRLTYLKRHTA